MLSNSEVILLLMKVQNRLKGSGYNSVILVYYEHGPGLKAKHCTTSKFPGISSSVIPFRQ